MTLAAASMVAMPALAGSDLHDYWDTRCKDCHGDSAAFARNTLRADGTRLLGRHHVDNLAEFLRQHYLADDLVEPVMQMLLAQMSTSPLFKDKCARCHDTAAAFARESLALRGGVLVGRAGGLPVRETLQHHGGLAPEQIAPMVSTLERVLAEVGGS